MSSHLNVPLEALAQNDPDVGLDSGALDTIGALALMIAHRHLPPGELNADMRPYLERSPLERARMRTAVLRVVQALVLLGWIERPS